MGPSQLILLSVVVNSCFWCIEAHDTIAHSDHRQQRSLLSGDEQKNLVVDFVRSNNYEAEEHFVITSDGYILRLDRIKGNQKTGIDPGKVVLVMHGTSSSSYHFVANGPKYALGFQLADAGYDVWLANSRGTVYSRNHTTLDPNYSGEFWKFSYDEVAEFDLPALYDFVLKETGVEKIFYIGYSAGSRVFLMASSSYYFPINDKTILFTMLANTGSWDYSNRDTKKERGRAAMWKYLEPLRIYELLGRSPLYSGFLDLTCGFFTRKFCLKILAKALGFPPFVKDLFLQPSEDVSEYVEAVVSGTSVRTISHQNQLIEGQLRKFDFGLLGNLMNYKTSSEPPVYDMGNVEVPVAFYYSEGDKLTPQTDVARILQQLPNVVKTFKINSTTFSHSDFMFGKDATSLLYNEIVDFMDNFSR